MCRQSFTRKNRLWVNGFCRFSLLILDKRFARLDKRSKLPKWIIAEMNESALNLSTDMAISLAKDFLRNMAQPLDKDPMGVSIWNESEVLKRQKEENDSITILQ
jgi:DNA excision repair protein ERCC-2